MLLGCSYKPKLPPLVCVSTVFHHWVEPCVHALNPVKRLLSSDQCQCDIMLNVVKSLPVVSGSPSAVLWTGEVWDFLSFTERYPSIIYNILLFGLTSALGQVGGLWTHCSFFKSLEASETFLIMLFSILPARRSSS